MKITVEHGPISGLWYIVTDRSSHAHPKVLSKSGQWVSLVGDSDKVKTRREAIQRLKLFYPKATSDTINNSDFQYFYETEPPNEATEIGGRI